MTVGGDGWSWQQLPSLEDRPRTGRRLGTLLAAMVLALAPPVAWAIHLGLAAPPMMAVGGLSAAAVAIQRRLRSPSSVVVVAASVGATVALTVDPAVGVWLAVGLVAGRWLAAAPGRSIGRPAPEGAMVPAVFLAVVGLVFAEAHRSGLVIGAALVAAVVVPVVAAVTGGRSLAWVDRFAAAVAHVLVVVLFGLLAIPIVVVPNLYGRLAGGDPFDSAGTWARPPRRRSQARSTWSNDRPPRRLSARRAFAAVATATVLVAGFTFVLSARRAAPPAPTFRLDVPTSRGSSSSSTPVQTIRYPAPAGLPEHRETGNRRAALDGSPWFRSGDWAGAVGSLFSGAIGTRAENPYELLDFHSRYANIVNGNRVSWTAPPCGCRRVTVWMYGGSTTWGMSQRDEHTIASELARTAFEHGTVVDVVNKGMNGFSHWQEAERFAWDLASGSKPDLVMFYDGVNDMKTDGPDERPVNDSADAIWDRSDVARGAAPPAPPGAHLLDPQASDPGGDAGQAIARRYARVTEMSRRTAAAAGIPVRYVWQPSRYSRPFEPAEPHYRSDEENGVRGLVQSACDHQAPGIIRACYALASVRGPLFTDDAHHNERAAQVIASFLYGTLRSDLEALAEGHRLPR